MSWSFPFWMILSGSLDLHSSHIIQLKQYKVTFSFSSRTIHLEFSHSQRHSTCMNCIVPLHLQGVISMFTSSFVSNKQIRQTFFPSLLFADFCHISSSVLPSSPEKFTCSSSSAMCGYWIVLTSGFRFFLLKEDLLW